MSVSVSVSFGLPPSLSLPPSLPPSLSLSDLPQGMVVDASESRLYVTDLGTVERPVASPGELTLLRFERSALSSIPCARRQDTSRLSSGCQR
eukprot:532151-Hanusia_phi.AAC.4